ncbi:MAG: peptidase M50 [Clostridium sp.]|nr:peptidase M50 [Clostridium sp.]
MYYNGYIIKYLLIFASILIHEIAHIIVAVFGKRKLVSIKIFAIGLSAEIKEKDDNRLNPLFIYISGPLSNILLALICFITNTYYFVFSDNMRFFIYANVALAIFNMLPVLPLDGGKIIRDILVSKIGLFKGYKYARRLSLGFAAVVFALGVLLLIAGIKNLSIILISVYMFCYQKFDKSEESLMNIKNLLYKRSRFLKKGIYPGRELVVLKSMHIADIIKSMDFDRFHIVYVVDECMRLVKVLTEQDVLEGVLKHDSDMRFEDLLKDME